MSTKHTLIALLLAQLLFVGLFLGFSYLADQAMDKTGMGDLQAWLRFNNFAGIAFYSAIALWLSALSLAWIKRVFSTPMAQLAIALPPFVLIAGWLRLLLQGVHSS